MEYDEEEDYDGQGEGYEESRTKKGNILPFWGNQQTMNLNPLIVTNIQNSPYFKVNLFDLKTYHEVIDEIYYKVTHLEPWERGSRKTAGQTGMCGGVRGVGAGGIVSSAFCLLYKLSTLKLTRKQLNGLLNHCDSPYIRGLGFMYIRFTQPPPDLWGWYEDYLDDEEPIDVKAGGGKQVSMGEFVQSLLVKLEWFDTRFPRIPVNVQKQISQLLDQRGKSRPYSRCQEEPTPSAAPVVEKDVRDRAADRDRVRDRDRERDRERDRRGGERDRGGDRRHDHSGSKHGKRSESRDHYRGRDDKDRTTQSRERRRSRSRSKERKKKHKHRDGGDYNDELRQYSEHRKMKKKHRRRSRSRSGSHRR